MMITINDTLHYNLEVDELGTFHLNLRIFDNNSEERLFTVEEKYNPPTTDSLSYEYSSLSLELNLTL